MRRNKKLRADLKKIRGSLRLNGKPWMAIVIDNAMSVISYQEEQLGFLESKVHVLTRDQKEQPE